MLFIRKAKQQKSKKLFHELFSINSITTRYDNMLLSKEGGEIIFIEVSFKGKKRSSYISKYESENCCNIFAISLMSQALKIYKKFLIKINSNENHTKH